MIKSNAKVWLKFSKVQLMFIGVCVRDSGLRLDEFHDLEISGRSRVMMGVHAGACDKCV